MTCLHCDEAIVAGESLINPLKFMGARGPVHVECFIRSIFGSAAHQLHDCPCYGGDREEPAGLTKRQCAQLAFSAYCAVGGAPEVVEATQ